MTRPVNRLRPRRSCLAVPGSSPKMLKKAQGLPADQVFLDLEDAVAPIAKPPAHAHDRRGAQPRRLDREDARGAGQRLDHEWAYEDVLRSFAGAGAHLDCIMLPKVQDAQQSTRSICC